MAANDDDIVSGRRTRSGRSAPVVNLGTGRRTRKSATLDDPDNNLEVENTEPAKEIAPVEGDIAMTTDTETVDDQPMTNAAEPSPETTSNEAASVICESSNNSSNDSSPDDQFIHIPDGNGVANNGIEHVDEEMVDQEERVEKSPEQTEVPASVDAVKAAAEEEEKQMIVEEESHTPPRPSTSDQTEAMISENNNTDDGQASALKRKSTSSDVAAECEHKKPKVAEKEVVEKEPPKLPDLEKYWKPVTEDSTNFTGWTYLLQYVDQETDVAAARDAYDAFLGHYPYCYGYWRKYADYEKTKGDKSKCEEVFERGLKAIPLSVDLWIHYLNYVKASKADDEPLIRSQYERAVKACGLEFRSDKLWEAYIKWETEGKRLQNVVQIYDRLLGTPTLGYNSHFGSFSDFVRANATKDLLEPDMYAELKRKVTEKKEEGAKEARTEDEEDALEEKIRKRVIADRKKIHEATVQEVTNRWTFEEAVKRPYFHVKPLERCQLKNWTDYLDYEIECGDNQRIIVLFERCLIACALYEEYWQKFVRFLMDATPEGEEDEDLQEQLICKTRDVFERACTIHHKDKPRLHLMWSSFEECHGNVDKAADILANIDKITPHLLQIEYRRINVERRRDNFEMCEELFETYVSTAKSQHLASSLAIKHARFVHKIMHDCDRALGILRAIQKSDPQNVRIPLQMIDLAMQRKELDHAEVLKIMDSVIEREGLDTEQKVLFAQRKVEFLEDFGKSPRQLQKAQKFLQTVLTTLQEEKKAKSLENNHNEMKQIHSTAAPAPVPPVQQVPPNQYANYSSYYGGAGADGSSAAYGAYSDSNYWNQYGQYAGNNYGNYYQ